jgi:DNA ligase 1
MKFLKLAELFDEIESLQSRNEMSSKLSDFLKKCSIEDVQIISYMIQGRVAPMFVNAEFNYSEKSLVNLLSAYTNKDIAKLRKSSGDIGDTVMSIWKEHTVSEGSMEIKEIYEVLWNIINSKGTGSIMSKNNLVLECLKKLSPLESKYFVRIVCGDLRLGLSVRSLLDVFSITLKGDKSLKDILEQSYGVCADVGYLARIFFQSKDLTEEGYMNLVNVHPGIPILSRLVERVGSFSEVFERFENEVLLQPKFDGLRCQIHKWSKGEMEELVDETVWLRHLDDESSTGSLFSTVVESSSEVRLFTRNLEDVTEMFPEIVESARLLPYDSFILDSEIVGWDYKKNRFLSYQETMQRRRKYSVGEKRDTIPVKSFVFDILYLNGDSLINTDTKSRVDILENVTKDTPGSIVKADSKIVSNEEDLRGYFNSCVEDGLEGIIVKQFEGGYRPGIRNYEWVKIKKSIDKELVDTVDMVIVGYYYGSGRRSAFGLGAILAAVYNEDSNTYDAITKVGTGMGDELLKDMASKLSEIEEKDIPKNVRALEHLYPDVWVLPKYVITVDADEITKNISNRKDIVGGGLSLRFPRLIEFDRDKGVEDITTVKELVRMYGIKK